MKLVSILVGFRPFTLFGYYAPKHLEVLIEAFKHTDEFKNVSEVKIPEVRDGLPTTIFRPGIDAFNTSITVYSMSCMDGKTIIMNCSPDSIIRDGAL